MHVLPTAMKEMVNSQIQTTPTVFLVELEVDDSTTLRYAHNTRDVTFGGQTYSKKNVQLSTMQADMKGGTPTWNLVVDNSNRALSTYLEGDKINGRSVLIQWVNTGLLGSTANAVPIRGEIVNALTKGSEAIFAIGFPDLNKVMFPGSSFCRNFCHFMFKGRDGRCKYAGGDSTCAKTPAACSAKNNLINCGACPGIPTKGAV